MGNYRIMTKADAMAFAIEHAAGDLGKADTMYRMFVDNMDLPGLEWMTENLTGHGGTEIDGRTYYTYDEAVEAVKQLGGGWRLPTQEEFERICDLGSEWQEEGPHGLPGRLFGGGLFLEAAGYRSFTSGALTSVGTEGLYWSSSSYAAGSIYAGYLGFHSGYVHSLYGNGRATGFSVRCVRNVKE